MKTLPYAMGTFLFLLIGCATPQDPSFQPSLEQQLAGHGYTLGKEVTSIFGTTISGWEYVDPKHIIVTTGPGRGYLLTFFFDCRELDYAWKMGYATTAGSLSIMDTIVSFDMGRPVQCRITAIHALQKVEKRPDQTK